jgi:hypothetical protein
MIGPSASRASGGGQDGLGRPIIAIEREDVGLRTERVRIIENIVHRRRAE